MADCWRTLNLGKLRGVLPDAWTTRMKTRFMREIREECKISTALHEVGSTLVRHALDLALDNFLHQHNYLHAVQGAGHLDGMPEILLSFNFPHPPLSQGNLVNIQAPVFTMSAFDNDQAAISPFGDTHGRFCHQALRVILNMQGAAQQAGYLRSVWENLIRAHILDGDSQLGTLVNKAIQGNARRQKSYSYSINEHLSPDMLGNMKSTLSNTMDDSIKTGLKDLARRYLGVPINVRDALVERTAAFFSPRHVKLANHLGDEGIPLLPLNINHPLFNHLPDNGLAANFREIWLSLIRPLHNLLSFSLDPALPRVQGLPVQLPGDNLLTASSIRSDAGIYQQWRQVVGDSRIAQRCLPALRYLARLHRHCSLNANGTLPSDYKSISIFPQKTAFRTEMTAFNARSILALVLNSLSHQWEGMQVFPAGQFNHARVSGQISLTKYVYSDLIRYKQINGGQPQPPLIHPTSYASRAIWSTMFPGLFREPTQRPANMLRKKSPLFNEHEVQLRASVHVSQLPSYCSRKFEYCLLQEVPDSQSKNASYERMAIQFSLSTSSLIIFQVGLSNVSTDELPAPTFTEIFFFCSAGREYRESTVQCLLSADSATRYCIPWHSGDR